MEHNPFEGYSFSWTQPYSVNPFYQINTKNHNIEKEMAVIDAIDRLVESGLTHPEADLILKNIVNNSKE